GSAPSLEHRVKQQLRRAQDDPHGFHPRQAPTQYIPGPAGVCRSLDYWPAPRRPAPGRRQSRIGLRRGRVDLRPLQLARVVDVDRLPFGEGFQRLHGRFPVAVARAAGPAEGQVHLSARGAVVDVYDPGGHVPGRPQGLVDVPGVDAARETVGGVVVDADGFLQAVDGDDDRRRTEDLLLGDAHPRVDVREQRRAVKEALRAIAFPIDFAAAEQARAFLDADARIAVHPLQLLFV